ncbi:cellulose binding domain-containing protein [Glycomyces sp. L485]|uniref:rhamnogalacturonan lyase family protein n=1 Tax=Glycomyces sp. L485 TaxID=2909235 RepID=UPI001F4A4D49|nr:cellulose binding domain-containing protein [Glycomyces sp. L485]MCH7231795.1 cellulose binding domain-containing protein [Glycomyces sp. L485]
MRPTTPPPRWRRALAGLAAAATAGGLVASASPAQAQDDGITVYLASDSTVQTYDPFWEPQAGWGQVFDRYFDEEVTVANHAIGGRSSRSFIEEGRLDAILDEIQPGDYLFVQFGHNDATQSRPERYTPPEDYKEYLRSDYIGGAIEKGAIPVLVTPVSRRSFDPDTGEFNVSFPEYVEKVHELVAEEGVAMVDLSLSSRTYLNEIGPEEAKSVFLHVPAGVYPNRPDGTTDDTHFQEYGAIQMARLVAEETATLGLSLSPHVVDVEPPADVPAVPTGLRTTNVSNGSVTFAWDEVDADIYRVYVRESGGEWRLGTTATVGVGRVAGLEEDTAYDFAVAAVNARGESAFSDVLTVTTATAGWKFDFGPASQVVGDGYSEINRGTAYTEEQGYGFITDMSDGIDRDRGGDDDPVGRDFVAWFGGEYTFGVDVPNGVYTARTWVGDYLGSTRTDIAFEGFPYGSHNAGSKSVSNKDFEGIRIRDGRLDITVSGQTGHLNGLELTRTGDLPPDDGQGPVPDVPGGLRATSVASSSVTLQWNEVDASFYRVYVRESGASEWNIETHTSTVSTVRVTGLDEGTAYDFAVTAVNIDGESAHSEVLSVTTDSPDWRFDFGPASQPLAAGYTEVNRGTAYTEEQGYGFITDMSDGIDRDRGGDDLLGRDFVAWFGGNYEFAVDVPDGIYTARVAVGDLLGSARTDIAFEGRSHGAHNSGSQSITVRNYEGIFVEDGQLNLVVSGQTGHLNGLELTRTDDLPDGAGDEPIEPCTDCAKQLESIDRSPVAVDVEDGVYLGWRKLGNDPADIAFNVYRDGGLIAQTAGTNLTDAEGTANATYWVAAVVDGVEVEYTEAFEPLADQYFDIDMNRPEGGTTPDGVDYTYSPNDATVADVNGDGVYELIQKWDPSNSKDNSSSGHTGNVYVDAYTLSGEQLWRIDLGVNIRAGAHYTSLSAYDFDGDGKAELALKTGDGTVDGVGEVIGDAEADHRDSSGRITTGPEYLTVFDGQTGAALDTVDFGPERGHMCDWGDCYGNRGDRLMAAVAYLDGQSPSLITSRGIYTKTAITAWDWDGESLEQRWAFNSVVWGPQYGGQGNHQMSIADVNGDGYDDIVYGSLTVRHDGRPLYSSELGHGDALHVSDLDPSREGQEIFGPYECMSCSGGIGGALRDAETGEVLWSMESGRDTGRGTCGDIDPNHVGAECWATTVDGEWDSRDGELRAADGTLIDASIPSANHMVWWDGDLGREILDHEFNKADYEPIYPFIAEWNPETGQQEEIFTPEGVQTNNGTKGNPVLTADLFGDWREEVVLRKESNDGVRIFTTTIETEHSFPTLMHDPQYRLAVAWQNESYNQPPWPSFYIGYDADPADVDWAAVGYDTVGSTEPPLVAGDCSVEYTVASDWGDGFVVQIKVTNTGESEIDAWDLVWKASGVESVRYEWGGEIALEGDTLVADPAFWNFPFKPGKTKQIGFQGTGDPNEPGVFLMNGQYCAAALAN